MTTRPAPQEQHFETANAIVSRSHLDVQLGGDEWALDRAIAQALADAYAEGAEAGMLRAIGIKENAKQDGASPKRQIMLALAINREAMRADAYAAGQLNEREKCQAIANTVAQSEYLARDRAESAGRSGVAECRQAGGEVAERIAEIIRARESTA